MTLWTGIDANNQ